MGAGAMIAAEIVDTAKQFGMSYFNNYLAAKREAEAREANFMYNQKSAIGAYGRTKDFYEKYQSPEALMRQYKEAGLSPSLMAAGGAGVGGTATSMPMGGGSEGISPNVFGVSQLEAAQAGLLRAQTAKVEEETKTERGENERGEAEINSVIQNTNNTKLKNAWQSTENMIKEIELALTTDKGTAEIDYLKAETQYLGKQLEIAQIKKDIDEATKKSTIQFINNKINEQSEKILLMQAQRKEISSKIKLNEMQIKSLWNEIHTSWGEVILRHKELKQRKEELRAQVSQWAIQNNLATEKNVREWVDLFWDNFNDSMGNVAKMADAIIPG